MFFDINLNLRLVNYLLMAVEYFFSITCCLFRRGNSTARLKVGKYTPYICRSIFNQDIRCSQIIKEAKKRMLIMIMPHCNAALEKLKNLRRQKSFIINGN